ncbi:hypothetical protein AB833_30395 [Chromatiales bacterium (ex Bugula neritina AB1)]|nr:hypothetical protein AB833_30395 [Chromatiales bacterium (ex Bugula neritina AB1)]
MTALSNEASTARKPDGGAAHQSELMMQVRNLDTLFYVIIAVAAFGLFGGVYVLLIQNDAYFEREYALLQRESEALDVRLNAHLDRNNQYQTDQTPPLPSGTVNEPSEIKKTAASQVADRELQKTAQSHPDKSESVVAGSNTDEENAPAQDEPSHRVANSPADKSAVDLTAVQHELAALRIELASQSSQLQQLVDENRTLRAVVAEKPAKTATVGGQIERPVVTVTEITTSVSKEEVTAVSTADQLKRASVVAEGGSEISRLVSQGYRAYQEADFALAASFYGRALQFDPYHRDANLGVAASAQQLGDISLAGSRYRHLLSLDPRDATAYSAMLNLPGQSNEIESEMTLHAQRIFNSHPANSGPLYAALGNYYSRNSRWADSRWAYSRAVEVAGGEADNLYNLAVALDNIGEYGLAVQHYERAISVTDSSVYSFDEEQVRERMLSLQARR